MFAANGFRAERGQASPEWVGLVLVVAVLIAGLLALLAPLPIGVPLARALAAKLICAVELSNSCEGDSELVAAYGVDLAAEVRDHAPAIVYEQGMRALPVDFRRCRSTSCADGAPDGAVWRSSSGEPVAAFVHVIDCRPNAPPFGDDGLRSRCSGPRAGDLYLQYWLYYPDSATLRHLPVAGSRGYHDDDWESYQVRVGPGGAADARASSHRGYNYEGGAGNWASDVGFKPVRTATEAVGLRHGNGWGPETGGLFVSGGSHAGNVKALPTNRYTPPGRLTLIPLEPIAAGFPQRFAISAPWLKQVWLDPEAEGTE